MVVAGHQPNLYPYGGFFAKLASVDKFVIVDNTQYVKKQFHNRNRVKFPDGEARWLSIPVRNAGRFKQSIAETEIDGSAGWRAKHVKTFRANYAKAPFFGDFMPRIQALLEREWTLLADYNIAVIELCADYLGITTPVIKASEAGISGVATRLILDICAKTGADAYLHGKHARDYVDFKLLENSGVSNIIQDYEAAEYPQLHGPFIPNLSILDIIFNCGPESLKVVMTGQRTSTPAFKR